MNPVDKAYESLFGHAPAVRVFLLSKTQIHNKKTVVFLLCICRI